MRKKITFSFLIKIIYYIKYLPSIILKIKNWPFFVLNYIGIKNQGLVYKFRNGLKIKTIDSLGSVTIAVIFIKEDYGKVLDNSVIIDIGANIGVYSIFVAQAKNTTIYAYEPMLENYNLFLENIRLNKLEKKIKAFNLAVGSKKEIRSLYLGGSPFHSLYPIKDSPFNSLYKSKDESIQKTTKISCVSLKDIFDENRIKKCDILKMDCEGAEFEILYNFPDEYFSKIKEIRMEYHNHISNEKNNDKYLKEFLLQKGFKITKNKKVNSSNGDLWLERK